MKTSKIESYGNVFASLVVFMTIAIAIAPLV